MKLNEYKYNDLIWVDCQAPSEKHLTAIAKQLKLPEHLLLSCLDPDYLPYIDNSHETTFLLFRLCELGASNLEDTIQGLTTKIAVFITNQAIYTFHRLPLKEISIVDSSICNDLLTVQGTASFQQIKQFFLKNLSDQISKTYDQKIIELERETDLFEEKIFNSKKTNNLLKEGFIIKRKASAYKKVIKFTVDVLNKTCTKLNFDLSTFSSSKEKLERYQFYSEDAFENIQALLNLHIAIQSQKTNEASHRTNEIVRVLTVLTLFFLPLNFIAGVFGMNFDAMPLVKSHDGFWISVLAMILISIGLFGYVIQKGWLKPPSKD